MKIIFKKEFVKKVRARPQDWRDPETILSGKDLTGKIEIKINGLLYKLGDQVEIQND